MFTDLRHYLEKHGFYVSSRLADRLGMRAKTVRLSFIYVTFATLGMGFLDENKRHYLYKKKLCF
jgi:hypothetical protein